VLGPDSKSNALLNTERYDVAGVGLYDGDDVGNTFAHDAEGARDRKGRESSGGRSEKEA